MIEFYVKQIDQQRVLQAIRDKAPVAITCLGKNGRIGTFVGRLHSIQAGQIAFDGYPFRVTMLPSSSNSLILADSN